MPYSCLKSPEAVVVVLWCRRKGKKRDCLFVFHLSPPRFSSSSLSDFAVAQLLLSFFFFVGTFAVRFKSLLTHFWELQLHMNDGYTEIRDDLILRDQYRLK